MHNKISLIIFLIAHVNYAGAMETNLVEKPKLIQKVQSSHENTLNRPTDLLFQEPREALYDPVDCSDEVPLWVCDMWHANARNKSRNQSTDTLHNSNANQNKEKICESSSRCAYPLF